LFTTSAQLATASSEHWKIFRFPIAASPTIAATLAG
jgi:hypothetical protein